LSNKKGKLKPLKCDSAIMRMVDIVAPSRAVIATENPVQRFDDESGQVVSEVLLMDGVEFRGGRSQIPIVDSHDDTTVRNILGSIQRLAVDQSTGELYGVPVFASDPDAQTIQQRMNEGHITDFSITAQPLESVFIPRGHSFVTNRGVSIEGPAIIHKRWQPHNASICATGADEQSTVRRSYTDLNRKVKRMDEALLGQLSAMGLPEGMVDPNQVLAWVVGKLSADSEEEATEDPVMNMDEPPAEVIPVDDTKPVENMDGEVAVPEEDKKPMVENSVARSASAVELIKRALASDQKRRNEIQAAVKIAKLDRAFADELCNSGVSVADANAKVIERMATQPLGSSVGADVRVTETGDDKFYAAVRDGLLERAQRSAKIRGSLFENGKPAEGHSDFNSLNMNRIAMACLKRAGAPVERMSNVEIAQAAMGNQRVMQKYRIQRSDFGAYHTSGSFTNLLLDASNKTLLAGYEEAPYTWSLWARQASSVEDFKSVNRMRFSEAGNPEAVPEGQDYPEKQMSDSKESYRVEKYGESFTVTWETIINDDLDAISRIPAMHGNAMRRLQNKKVYEVLTSNPTMGDGKSLFDSTHASGDNTSGGAAAPSATTLNAGFAKMMLQKGLSSDAILNIQPRFIIVPVNYSATTLQFVASMADPTAGGSNAGNSNTLNLYGPNGSRPLQVIVEPQLDAASTTNWYLAADNGQVDTVELAFLSGEESPVLESEWNMKNDTYLYKIRQTFGVKAIDWRGLFRNSA
jgi:hypothetical protein